MLNVGPLTAEIGWRVWGTPANFNGFRVLASLLHRRATEVNQTSHDVWLSPGLVHCTFFGALAPKGILPRAKFTLRQSLAFSYIGNVTARQSSSGREPNCAAWYKEWNYRTFAPRHFRSRERKPPNEISPTGKFTANGKKTKTNAFDFLNIAAMHMLWLSALYTVSQKRVPP